MSARPRKVRISGEDFTIKFRKFASKENALGLCNYKISRLEIATGQTPVNAKDTLLHEILHAILLKQGHTGSCFKDEVEERYVNAIATGLIGVFQDNPEVAAWLMESV